jgi:hypothetical protein
MSKTSRRRKEDTAKVEANLGRIKWGTRDKSKDDFKINGDSMYEEAESLSDEMRLHHSKMELPEFLKEQAE